MPRTKNPVSVDLRSGTNGYSRGLRLRELITGNFRVVPRRENCAETPGALTAARDHSRRKKPFAWGIGVAVIGFVCLVVSIWLEHYPHTKFEIELGLTLLGHIGIALFIMGLVGIAVEFKNWTEYFEERLAYTIREKEFLKSLSPEELSALLGNVFLSYYKVDNFDSNSFLEFFKTKLQGYIGSPFREDVQRMMTIAPPGADGFCSVKLDFSYKCRKITAKSSKIQQDVIFKMDRADIKEAPSEYVITLKIPPACQENFFSPSGFPEYKDGKIVLRKDDFSELQRCKKGEVVNPGQDGADFYKFTLSLAEFSEMDGLEVQQHVEYSVPTGRFTTWATLYPSKGVRAVFKYPEDEFEFLLESLGMDPINKHAVRQPGLYSIDYDSWVLPYCGLAYGFIRKRHQDEVSAESAIKKGLKPDEAKASHQATDSEGTEGEDRRKREISNMIEEFAVDFERTITKF